LKGNYHYEEDEEGFINFNGEYFNLKRARLYTKPYTNISLYMAGSGTEAIQISARLTDGLITTAKPDNSHETFKTFDDSAREAGKDPESLDKIAKPKISYSDDYDKAFRSSEFWRTSQIDNAFDRNINDPRILESVSKKEVTDKKLEKSVLIVTSIEDLIKPIEAYFDTGFTQVYIHSTSPDEIEFIKMFTKKVLPYFQEEKILILLLGKTILFCMYFISTLL
jgi:coenzyme F420-dependent glucose-6-phosphate dehydrogenase